MTSPNFPSINVIKAIPSFEYQNYFLIKWLDDIGIWFTKIFIISIHVNHVN